MTAYRQRRKVSGCRHICCCVLVVVAGATADAIAAYPDRPIRFVVPQAPGSASDTGARIVAAELSRQLGQQLVIDNRPGGALVIGMELVARAAPDGYTIGFAPIGAQAISPHMVKSLPYDIGRDFSPIGQISFGHMLLAVTPALPVNSVRELIDYARQHPGKLLSASSGNGTPGHVCGELFKSMTATSIVHVPYKGGQQGITDLIAGQVQMMFESLNSIAPYAKSGRVRGLAVSGARRTPAFPDLPTIAEAGVPGYEAVTWSGIVGPAGMPRAVVMKLNAEINKAMGAPALKERYAAIGAEPIAGTPEQFAELIRKDSAKWAEVIRRSGAKIE